MYRWDNHFTIINLLPHHPVFTELLNSTHAHLFRFSNSQPAIFSVIFTFCATVVAIIVKIL